MLSKSQPKDALIFSRASPKKRDETVFLFSDLPTINILNGSRFMITSREGDISESEHGVFRDDTRYLSTFISEINGSKMTALTSNNTTHYSAAYYLTNQTMDVPNRSRDRRETIRQSIEKESFAIVRKRFIEEDIREEYTITNVSEETLSITLAFFADADFADLFEVKAQVFGKKPDLKLREEGRVARSATEVGTAPWKRKITRKFLNSDNAFDFAWTDKKTGFRAETLLWFSKRGKVRRNGITYDLTLHPKEAFHVIIVIIMLSNGEKKKDRYTDQYFLKQEEKIERALTRWDMTIPKLETNWEGLSHAYKQSLVDLVSLRMTDPRGKQSWVLPAAGCPWFMTLFGRDTLITSYQTLLFGGNLAEGAIEALSEYQSASIDPNKDAEPGKIIHEMRYGGYSAASGHFPYYGSVDSTPLYLILISEIYRWSGNEAFVNRYQPNIMRALNWIDEYGDQDGDGFLEYKKKTVDGLDNQSWKDSWNSIQFADGRIAKPPIATCEVQGYAYLAKLGIAEIAREVWKDKSLSKKLIDEANELKELFNEKFWMEDKGYYALALDKEKTHVDSMTSNNGQLLWTRIVEDDKVERVTEGLISKDMFSGYGIRTLSSDHKGYSPIGYHNGCVWPHDNSLIAKGLANYGKDREASLVIDGVLSAGYPFGYTFPETFAGFSRLETEFPVRYPTSSSPQAWAAGSALLFIRTLLGISPERSKKTIEIKPIFAEKETSIVLRGIKAFGKNHTISMKDGSKPQVYETP